MSPRGIKNKNEAKTESSNAGAVVVNVPRETIKSEVKQDEPKKEEAKKEIEKPVLKLEPLAPGQAYFESPEGEIIIGQSDKDQVWSRKTNGGKGGWINKKR